MMDGCKLTWLVKDAGTHQSSNDEDGLGGSRNVKKKDEVGMADL